MPFSMLFSQPREMRKSGFFFCSARRRLSASTCRRVRPSRSRNCFSFTPARSLGPVASIPILSVTGSVITVTTSARKSNLPKNRRQISRQSSAVSDSGHRRRPEILPSPDFLACVSPSAVDLRNDARPSRPGARDPLLPRTAAGAHSPEIARDVSRRQTVSHSAKSLLRFDTKEIQPQPPPASRPQPPFGLPSGRLAGRLWHTARRYPQAAGVPAVRIHHPCRRKRLRRSIVVHFV